ncbi:MAG: ABC transporter ATP-binding protein [Lachnospiraceae bacterium]|nr:ABC transporter ATP-binding protein [Lachnospiraceae bacterium]
MGQENDIRIDHIRQEFALGNTTLEVLRDIDLTIKDGEFVTVVGGSGCGKSTLLRLIAGIDKPVSGHIYIHGEEVEAPSLDTGVLFQESRLLPWYTVEKNIAYGLSAQFSKSEKKDRVRELIELVGLTGFEKALPEQLSGGMQKRVAIARTLGNRPKVLLLDEPFGALDAFTKMNLQSELLKIWEKEKMTTLMVTHDIEEAIYLGNRVVVMSPKPGVVKKVVPIHLTAGHSRTSSEFAQLRRIIYREFFEDNEKEPEYTI